MKCIFCCCCIFCGISKLYFGLHLHEKGGGRNAVIFGISSKTRMHSSRMRTGRSLAVCCSLLPRGGVSLPGGFSLVWGGLLGPGGGFSLVPGGGVSLVPGRGGGGSPETPPVDRITDTCKNITLATTSLRPVINKFKALLSPL